MTDASWIPVEGIDAGADGFPQPARIGAADVLVFRLDDGFRAVQRTCPHQHASFTDAQVIGGRVTVQNPFTARSAQERASEIEG